MDSYRKKNEKELYKDLSQRREDLRNFRFNLTGSKLKNIKEGLSIKKDIARILTVLRQKK